ncbi:hypothetical protein K438DRAFT_1822752 [Mycena galopus ATCC 62051]|nr:hypothetical protein K438DRAFT_1822752 [Mycena galopus ATCC 62051]
MCRPLALNLSSILCQLRTNICLIHRFSYRDLGISGYDRRAFNSWSCKQIAVPKWSLSFLVSTGLFECFIGFSVA